MDATGKVVGAWVLALKSFIEIIMEAEPITEFDIGSYFALVEKMAVYDGSRLIVSLLDGTDIECEIE